LGGIEKGKTKGNTALPEPRAETLLKQIVLVPSLDTTSDSITFEIFPLLQMYG